MASTPFGKIAKHLSGSNSRSPSTELRAGKRRWDNKQNVSSPSPSSSKKGCGNFGHGTPGAKYPQHCILFFHLLRVSVVSSLVLQAGGKGFISRGRRYYLVAGVIIAGHLVPQNQLEAKVATGMW